MLGDTFHAAPRPSAPGWTICQLLAVAAGVFFFLPAESDPDHRSGRSRLTTASTASIHFAAAPAASLDVAAAPAVTTPAACVARFSIFPLPLVAAAVDIERHRRLALEHIGGLYGP